VVCTVSVATGVETVAPTVPPLEEVVVAAVVELGEAVVEPDGAAVVATGGALLGGIGGLLLGLGAFTIPGLGLLAAAGPLVTAITGAGVGAGLGGIVGALTEAGIPEEESHFYVEGLRRGSTIVMVHVKDGREWKAEEILRGHGAIDIERRKEQWRSDSPDWAGLPRYDTAPADRAAREHEREPAIASSATLERPPATSQIPPLSESAQWQDDFHEHYRRHFGHSGLTYDEYRPAYEYGYHAASDPRFRKGDWDETETNIRQDWSTRGHGSWDDVKDAVHCGWTYGRKYGVTSHVEGFTSAPDMRDPIARSEESVTGDTFDDASGRRI